MGQMIKQEQLYASPETSLDSSDNRSGCLARGVNNINEKRVIYSEVLEHRFFGRDEIPEELFPADSRAIRDWKKGIDEIVVH